ncbi:MAG: hypothetical protein K2K96_00780 [Lachnospiraceae bacterium]|nr:hypothetical protein [Lachnospiraceae bacterium]
MIDKHNFWSIVSGVFTCLLIGKIILESIMGYRDVNYAENILTLFIITVVATAILGMHKYLQNVPVLLVMFLQYVGLIGSVMGAIWIISRFTDVAPGGYQDMFWSVTIPYVVLAGVYYISFFREVKKANELLLEINQEK